MSELQENNGAPAAADKTEAASSDTVTRLTFGEREIILVGTAHISEASVVEVEQTIRELNPDRICVELDEARQQTLTQAQQWQELDIFKIFREKKAFLLLGNLVLGASQRRMGMDMGVKPGAEMKAAIDTAAELGIPVSLIDRQIQITLRRAWSKSGFWGKNKLLASLLAGAFTNEKLTEAELEKLKQKGELQAMLEETAAYLPSAKQVLIDERDLYLARKLQAAMQSGERKILAVIGAGHVPGMVAELQRLNGATTAPGASPEQAAPSEGRAAASATPEPGAASAPDLAPSLSTEELEAIPEPGILSKIFPWLISGLIVFLIVLGFVQGGLEQGFANLGRWMLTSGSLAAIGALVALGHPLTILVTFIATPITVLSPTLGIGFISGPLEAWLRKPRVADFENLRDSAMSVKGFYKNRVTRILLVFILTSIGASIGTFIAFPALFPAA